MYDEIVNNVSQPTYSIVFTKLKPEIKEWLKNQYNNIDKRIEFIKDIATYNYQPYHRIFRVNAKKYIKNFPLNKHNPTDFLSICLLTMSNNQIDNINEDLSNLDLTKIFTYVEDDYNDNEELNIYCCCGHTINKIITYKNKETNISFTVGTDCALKNKLMPIETLNEIKKNIKIKKENKKCVECGKYTIPKNKIDQEICKDCIKYKHHCYKCDSQYENNIKNPSNRLCEKCNNENIKHIRKIHYENNLWNQKCVLNLSDFNIGDTIDIDGIRFFENKYHDNDYNVRMKQYDTNEIINSNFQLKNWINTKYKNINKSQYINNTFELNINIEIINKYINKYEKYTVILKIEEVDVEYE
jgi:hypothetical protein